MVIPELKKLISKGETKATIERLLEFVSTYYTRFAPEVLMISSRFNQINLERNRGTLPIDDYKIEMNSITYSLLQIIESIEGLTEDNFKKKKRKEDVIELVAELDKRFAQSRRNANTIKSNPTRLREKNDVARELGDIFINHPELIDDFYNTSSEGIITGIANKYKRVPEISAIDFFESVAKNISGNFTKCCIVNALAEIIYTGQLRFGDDERIYNLLDILNPNSAQTVEKNISRVNTELNYFLGKVISDRAE
ncbi:MAG: hypothetical protein R2828_10725 [Saprospiraceae bacterium]